ncbi:hypothetical protein EAY39_15410 [Vibrio anguillarum]|uniref:hypothetical protein n=1 Tax=Vibrio anguillarum TaxID=55601 RepID=UPI0018C21623|nr:hypothetical protein [Vibrio anguillarum]MBF4342151.1 hypothetical protein [Vibrio anguillarum]
MDIVTQQVKNSILKYFTIYPSRQHVLRHIVLGNGTGYEWVKDSETEFYILESGLKDYDNKDVVSIEKREVDSSRDIQDKLHFSTGDEFYNHIASFVEENIDIYSSPAFYSETLNLKPKKPCDFSRGYNRLCDAPDIELIHPDWLEAIKELVDFELSLRNPWGGSISERRAIDLLVREHYAWVDQYKMLLRFNEKYNQLKKTEIDKVNKRVRLLSPTIEQRFEKSAHKSVVTLEQYRKFREAFFASDDVIHYDLDHWIELLLATERKYVNSGRLNATFMAEAIHVLENSALFNHYNQYATMSDEISRRLKIHSRYESQVKAFVNDYGMNGVLGY